jgi:iron(III) transport system ATP-binding protein
VIEIFDLTKIFLGEGEKVLAVNKVSLTIPEGKLFTLLGPSGCGKSTTLRCVAGLEKPEDGEIKIGGETVFSSGKRLFVPPNKRDIGMVFQSYAIWPHMTVFDNVAYPLRIKRVAKEHVKTRVKKALHTVGLQGLEGRLAPQLSGGQQQRVALARALVIEPKILLLDEPLSNLDAKLREEMRLEIKELQQRLKITALYVTHDQCEALAISDLIAVMSAGKVLDLGTPKQIYDQPKNRFTADFVGLTNILRGKILKREGAIGKLALPWGEFFSLIPEGSKEGEEILVFVRPENVKLSKERPSSPENTFEGEIKSIVYMGEIHDYQILIKGTLLRARFHSTSPFKEREKVYVGIEPGCSISIPPE